MSWYDFEPAKSMAQLRAESLSLLRHPSDLFRDMLGERAPAPVAAEGRKQFQTPLGEAFGEAVGKFGGGASSSRMAKARGYLRAHCLLDLTPATRTSRTRDTPDARHGGGADGVVHGTHTYATAFRLEPPPAGWWKRQRETLRPVLAASDAAVLARGGLPTALRERFTVPSCPLLPRPRGVSTSCDCLDGTAACKHVLCTMLGFAVLLDREPLLLLRVHGLNPADLMPRLTDSLPLPEDRPADALDEAAAARLFGEA